MRALVTGCAGFIGSHLTESLLESGESVVGIDCFNENYARADKLRNLQRVRDWDTFEFVPIDLSRGDLAEFVADADVTFHLAAEPGVRASWGERFEMYVNNNVLATQLLLEAARLHPEKRFVFASSSSIYGNSERLPTPEHVRPEPYSPYGVTKLASENLCQAYHANWGVQTVVLRYFSVYGPRQRPDMAFHRFCTAALRDEPITVLGDGEQRRDFTYVEDVVAATRAAMDAPGAAGGIYNVGGGSRASVNETLEMIAELAGQPLDVRYMAAEHGDVRETGADISRAERELGFRPRMTLAAGLEEHFRSVAAAAERVPV